MTFLLLFTWLKIWNLNLFQIIAWYLWLKHPDKCFKKPMQYCSFAQIFRNHLWQCLQMRMNGSFLRNGWCLASLTPSSWAIKKTFSLYFFQERTIMSWMNVHFELYPIGLVNFIKVSADLFYMRGNRNTICDSCCGYRYASLVTRDRTLLLL